MLAKAGSLTSVDEGMLALAGGVGRQDWVVCHGQDWVGCHGQGCVVRWCGIDAFRNNVFRDNIVILLGSRRAPLAAVSVVARAWYKG